MTLRAWCGIQASGHVPALVTRLLVDYLPTGSISAGSHPGSVRGLAEEISADISVISKVLRARALVGPTQMRCGDSFKTVEDLPSGGLKHFPIYEAIVNCSPEVDGSATPAHLTVSAGRRRAAPEADLQYAL